MSWQTLADGSVAECQRAQAVAAKSLAIVKDNDWSESARDGLSCDDGSLFDQWSFECSSGLEKYSVYIAAVSVANAAAGSEGQKSTKEKSELRFSTRLPGASPFSSGVGRGAAR